MRKSRFTDAQVIEMIKEQGWKDEGSIQWIDPTTNGMATTEVCRKHGLGRATFYKLKAKFRGIELSDAPAEGDRGRE